MPAWQTWLLGTASYLVVSSWIVHTAIFAMLIHFQLPSGELCLCASWDRYDVLEWYRVLRAATAHP